jgi:hypothetical protein
MDASLDPVLPESWRVRPLQLDPEVFHSQFPFQPFLIQHHLCDHSLFSIPRLLELAKALPKASVEYNDGNISVDMGYNASPDTGLSAEATIRRIREVHSWMVLKNVEKDADYRELLNKCLDQVCDLTESRMPGMHNRQGFIFLSSPNSITPFHCDPEHNFLLQFAGNKFVSIFDPRDSGAITDRDIEHGLFSKNRNLPYSEAIQARGKVFELTPGTGLYFPVAAPHWVRNGPEVSISFSITFDSRNSKRERAVREFNAGLRPYGFDPRPPGRSHVMDTAKYHAFRVLHRLRIFHSGKGK